MEIKSSVATKSDSEFHNPFYQVSDYQQFKISKSHEELRVGLRANLLTFLSNFASVFQCGKRNNSHIANELVHGLFCASRGERNLERINEQTHSGTSAAHYQKLQHFITHSPWDSNSLMNKIAKRASDSFENWEDTAYIIDEKAHLKKGKHSVGVDNQYAGTVGKTENCQVGVYSALVNGKYATPINTRLFLSKNWIKDKARCQKAKIPKSKRIHKTKQQLALEMIKEDLGQGIRFGWVGGDALYGHGYELSQEIENLGQNFVFDVHKDQPVYLTKPIISLPKNKKTGRPHTRPVSNIKPIEVRDYVAKLKSGDFQEIIVRKTPKGYLKYNVHVVKVWTWIAPSYREKGQSDAKERTLIIRKNKTGATKTKPKYSLTNIAIEDATIERFAYMQAQRFWIEKSFKDNSKDIGMSDYQIRKYNSWYHYQAITMLAMLFAMEEQIRNKDNLPLLSHRDIKLLVHILFTDNTMKRIQLTIQQMLYRHRQRQKDIDRYYTKSNVTK